MPGMFKIGKRTGTAVYISSLLLSVVIAVMALTVCLCAASAYYVTPDVGLNLRCGPAVSYASVAVMPRGTALTVQAVSGGWALVSYENEVGWCSMEYLSPTSPISPPQTPDGGYPNTYQNTGDGAADIIGVARTQLGYAENSSGYTKYGDYCGVPRGEWCAMFITWCARQAGVGESSGIAQPSTLATADGKNSSSSCCFHVDYYNVRSYTPKAGDLIFYLWDGSRPQRWDGDGDHVGLVTEVRDGYVYTVEGNTNVNSSDPLPYRVMLKRRLLTDRAICGYGSPVYRTAQPPQAVARATFAIAGLSDAYAGEKTGVSLTYSGGAGLTAGELKIHYDAAQLTYAGAVAGAAMTVPGTSVENDAAAGVITVTLGKSGVLDVAGELFRLSFVPAPDAYGETLLHLTADRALFSSNSAQSVECAVAGAAMNISKKDSGNNENNENNNNANKPADINGDSEINLDDAVLLLKYLAGWNVEIHTDAADCNNDKSIDLSDAIYLLKHLAGWNVTIGENSL